jgi:hypothetical protein
MTIGKIISGGQTGVDIAALRAARSAGIATGGWCPKNWMTELGPQPERLKPFGLCEHMSAKYPPRTGANVEDGDCTLIIADQLDNGSKLTAELCRAMNKPMLHLGRAQIGADNSEALKEAFETFWLFLALSYGRSRMNEIAIAASAAGPAASAKK